MKTFEKRAELVEAEQWLGTEEQTERLIAEEVIMVSSSRDGSVLVPTLSGNITCRLNDYLVKGADGVYSVFDVELFEDNYELVDDVLVEEVPVV